MFAKDTPDTLSYSYNAQIMVIEKLMPNKNFNKSSINHAKRDDDLPVGWKILDSPAPYTQTLERMRTTATRIAQGEEQEQVWLVEHPPLYTSGTSANKSDLLLPHKFPVFSAGRGGQFTYHGPGQRVAYVMLNLKQRGRDIRLFVQQLEGWIIDTLSACNIVADRSEGRIGVWVTRSELGPNRVDKIAAIGIRVSKWVSFHGISLNISPDLSHYQGIVPCGISDQGVTSFEDLGHLVTMEEIDTILRQNFERHFGPTIDVPAPNF